MEKGFLDRLQSAPEPTKTKWLIATTVIVMVIVIWVWLKYFNTLVRPASTGFHRTTETHRAFSFREAARSGAALVVDSFKKGAISVRERLTAPKEYRITP